MTELSSSKSYYWKRLIKLIKAKFFYNIFLIYFITYFYSIYRSERLHNINIRHITIIILMIYKGAIYAHIIIRIHESKSVTFCTAIFPVFSLASPPQKRRKSSIKGDALWFIIISGEEFRGFFIYPQLYKRCSNVI